MNTLLYEKHNQILYILVRENGKTVIFMYSIEKSAVTKAIVLEQELHALKILHPLASG